MTEPAMPTLLLIRHGENDVMHTRLAGRMPEVHLNAKGRQQAARLAAMLCGLPIEAVYTSPLERAVETAEPLAKALDLPMRVTDPLIEVDYGEWQGRTYKELNRTKLWKLVQKTPDQAQFPDGERLVDVQQRVLLELERIGNAHELAACVTHADVIRLAMTSYLGMPVNEYHRLVVFPASVSVVRFGKERPLVICLNQVAGFGLPVEKKPRRSKKEHDQPA